MQWHLKICAILPLETVGRFVQIFFVSFHFKGFSYKKWTLTFIFFSVHASCTNGLGQSRSSKNVEEVQTLGQVPEAPSNPVDFVHPSNTSVRLDLFMWNKQTCPVDYFIVSYRKEMVSISITHSEDLISEVILWPSWICYHKVTVGSFLLKIGTLAGICFSLYTFMQFYINISSFYRKNWFLRVPK